MGRFDKEIRIIQEHCYQANLMDLSETTMINKALDCAIRCMKIVGEMEESMTGIREITQDQYKRALSNGKCLTKEDKQEVFSEKELYGYGVYSTQVYAENGKTYVQYCRGDSCD